MKRLVFATNNKHKLEEARRIMGDSIDIVPLEEIGCHDDIPETADTLEGNAIMKARWVHDRYGVDCFADDTGLMVDALGGAPGVYSARYAGPGHDSEANMKKLLADMEGAEHRDAHFSTSVALVTADGTHIFEGRVDGSIAREPGGDSGFGYDPVFIARETGKRFAEMSADEKNAISHRGRAMRKLRDFLIKLTVVMVAFLIPAGASAAEQWRIHQSYDGDCAGIFDTKKYTYFLGYMQKYDPLVPGADVPYISVYRYDKEGDELIPLNSQTYLSGNVASAVDYNYDKGYLLVAYSDGNIDMLYEDGRLVNLPGLMLSSSDLKKNINSITFYPEENKVFLATDFGYVTIDDKKGEISSSRNFSEKVLSVAKHKTRLFVATLNGLFEGPETALSLDKFYKVNGITEPRKMVTVGTNLMDISYGQEGDLRVARYEPQDVNLFFPQPVVDLPVNSFGKVNGKIMAGFSDRIYITDPYGTDRTIMLEEPDFKSPVGTFDFTEFWFSHGRVGFQRKKVPAGDRGTWTVLSNEFRPNASTAFMCPSMAYHPWYGMLVRNHGFDNFWTVQWIPDLLSGYKNMRWTPLSSTYREDGNTFYTVMPKGIAINPNNQNQVFCGSFISGILRLDLKDIENSLHMSRPSEEGFGKPGFVQIVPEPVAPNNRYQTSFGDPVFDAGGNLWIGYADGDLNNVKGKGSLQAWLWTKEDIFESKDAATFRPFRKFEYSGVKSNGGIRVLPLKHSSSRNLVLLNSGVNDGTIRILNHAGTFDRSGDDRTTVMDRIVDQDGSGVNFTTLYSWLEDPQTGTVWVGTHSGVFTFDPAENFVSPGSVRKIKVARNDGTDLADYLLDMQTVSAIAIDGAGNKWFGTIGGGLVCTSSDGRTIRRTYSADNSPLPSNDVYGICYNPDNNSMMISTSMGLAELFLTSGSPDGGDSEVRAYPNPVAPEYLGYVTIDALPDNAAVKIIDAHGNLVKELGLAAGGEVKWDVTNLFHKRVQGGVYYVLATNGPNAESYSKVTKILVVN